MIIGDRCAEGIRIFVGVVVKTVVNGSSQDNA